MNLAAEEVLKMWRHIGFSLLLARLFWTKDLNIMNIWSDTLTDLDKILSIEMQWKGQDQGDGAGCE